MANVEHGPGKALVAGAATARLGMVRAGLWLIAAVLAVRQVVAVLSTPSGERLTDLETWIGPEGVLHVKGSLYDADQFTGTPFGGLVLKPLARGAEQALGWAWTFGTLGLVVVLGLVAARALPKPVTRRTSLLAAPVAVSLLMLSLPVRNTLHLGQTSIIPVLLVLLGCFAARGEKSSGLLIGIGAALQPTVLLFAPLLWFTGRRRAAVSSGVTFAACTLLAWAAMPHDSWTYWVHHLAGAGLGSSPDGLANQSLHGALLRFGLEGPLEIGLFLLLAAAVAVARTAARGALRAGRTAPARRRPHRLRRRRRVADDLAAPASVGAARRGRPRRQEGVRPVRVAGRGHPRDDAPREDAAAEARRSRIRCATTSC